PGGEYVAQMGVATGATRFGPAHAICSVCMLSDAFLIRGSVEAGPAGSGIEFCFRIEQRCAARDTVIHSRFMVVPVLARKGALRTRLAGDLVLFGSQLLAPFGFGLGDFFGRLFAHIALHL